MIADRAREEITSNSSITKIHACICLNLNSAPLKPGGVFDNLTDNEILVEPTRWHLVHKKRTDFPKYKDKDFILCCNLFSKESFRIGGYSDVVKMAEEGSKAAAFLIRWTNLSPELFELSKQNKECMIPICFDCVRYDKYLRELDPSIPHDYPTMSYAIINNVADYVRNDYNRIENERRIESSRAKKAILRATVEKEKSNDN